MDFVVFKELNAEIKFRFATKEDAAAIVLLVNSAYRGDSSRKGWTTEADLLGGQRTDEMAITEDIVRPGSFFLMALKDQRLISTVHLEKKDDGACYFGMFTVEPEMQASGMGKLVMEESEKIARSWNCDRIEMTVITVRSELIAFYERRGYKFTGKTKEFPSHNERFGLPKRSDLVLGIWEKRI